MKNKVHWAPLVINNAVNIVGEIRKTRAEIKIAKLKRKIAVASIKCQKKIKNSRISIT